MSRTLRRILSWVFVLTLVAAAAVGRHYLPGRGVLGEIRWAFAHGATTGQQNRAFGLVALLAEHDPAALGDTFATLLRESDPQIVGWSLSALDGRLTYFPSSRGVLDKTFLEWIESADDATKLAHLKSVVVCLETVFYFTDVRWTAEHRRWLALGAVDPDDFTRHLAATCIGFDAALALRDRLGVLHAGNPRWKQEGPMTPDASKLPSAWAPLELPEHEQVVELTRDSVNQVRWAAGQILAVCGDQRGLPALCEWLQTKPKGGAAAEKVLSELFGPDWRKPFESGRAASQPSTRDGGG
jgi:hypothetical protein